MADWKKSAKQIVNNNKTSSPATQNTTPGANNSSGGWKSSAKQILDSVDYVAPEKHMYELKSDTKSFGTVSYGAYKAVTENKLHTYTPKNEAEKKILDEVKSYIGWKAPEDNTPLIISDYKPHAYNMTKNEYLRRQQSNPDMPEFGSYEYFKNREETLRPILDEIANDADRTDDTYRAWAENYGKDNNWAAGKPVQKLAKELYEKFKYQDAILAEYKDIDAQLKKFDKQGIHYDSSLEIDTKSGAAEAKYAKERLDAIVNATTFTNDEMVMGVYGELPEEKQKEYDNVGVVAGQRNVEAEKEDAYDYYAKNKDNTYKDNLWGRITGNYKVGRIGIKANDAGFTSYKASTDDIEAVEVYQSLSARIQNRNNATFQNDNAVEEITAIVAQYAPQGVDQAVNKTVGSVLGAAVGWASGVGAGTGARIGGSTAVANYMYQQTAGATFVRLLQESDLSIEDAKALAESEALASGAVEFGLDYVTSGLWKGVGSATKGATSEMGEQLTKALVSKGISEKGAKTIINIAKNAGKLTLDALGEGTEEWIQEGMSITADRYAAEGKSASAFDLLINSFDLTQYSKEDFSRMNQSFLAGTIIGFGHGGLNAATSFGINKTVSAAAGAVDAKVLGEEINKSGETEIITDAVEMAKDNVSPEVVEAVKTVEKAIAEDNTPPAEAVGTVVKSVLTDEAVQETAAETEQVKNEIDENPASVSVGDTFKDTKTGNTITVVERDAENTTVEISTGEKTETREFTNNQADTLVTNEQFEQMESSEVISPEDAQRYNIVVSNLKRKAEELGLLDTNFFNALQNVNLYNPSVNDRALISTEFRRAFAGNTDPLVTSWLDSISIDVQSVTSINEQNMPVSTENTPVNDDVTDTDVDLAEGEILSLKHTKNVYSLFKGAMRVVIGKDIITDGFVVLPLTDETLAGVKKVIGDSAPIQENPNFEMSKFYHADNDVIIQGNPKVGEATAGNKTVKAYTFRIADVFYSCQQKFIDAFNNGKNVIKANKSNNIPWTVHNENGKLVALFLGLRANVTEQSYNQMQTVAEIKAAEQQKKAENANKPFNQNEVRLLIENGRPFFSVVHGINYVGDGHIFTVCDEAAADFIKSEYRKQNANSNYEIEHKEGFGGMVEKLLAEAKELAEANAPVSYSDADTLGRAANAYIVGDYAIFFNKKYADLIKKHSKSMKIISSGKLGTTILVGYDADGNITGFALPILVKGEVTTKDGKTVPFVTEADLKNLVTVDAESGIKSDKTVTENPESVTEPTESVIKKADSVTETPENVSEDSSAVVEDKNSSKKSNELFKKLTDNIPLLENDAIVYAATGKEFEPGEKKLSQQVYEYFESLGGMVHRENFGDVAINDKGVDSSIAHGMGRAKAIAFASVPAVIEKGRQIDFVENWKGRNYDSYVFAAPIQIGTQRAFVGVVVTKSGTDNRYYLHEVSDNEGNIIIIKKDDVSFKSKSEATNDSSSLGETSPVNSISQDNENVNSSVNENTEPQQKDSTPSAYDVAYFDDLGAAIRKGESVSLKDMRTAVDAILMNHGEAIKAELSQLKNDELKKRISIYDRGRITKKAEMVDSIYTDMLSSLYYALSGKETITYIYDGTGFEAQQSKMLFDISRELTEETFSKRLADNAEKYKKQVAAREEKLAKVKNPQTLEDYAYKKRYFGLSDEETIQYENLYAEERRKAREDKKAAKTTKDTSGADAFFANADNYTIEKTTHTKTGEDVWVVRPASRLETEQWKQLNEQMKALGGSYWRGNQGWNFKKDPTAALSSAEETETETVKGSTNAEKLRAVAEGMQKTIDDKFRDRLTNTSKRAREAASAEAEGERLKRLQDTINNIADALENGENTLLDKIDSKAQVETLMSMLRTGRRNRISETLPDITYDERLQEQDKPYSNDDAKYAEYPLTKLHESAVTEYIRAAEGKTGYKQITDRLKKSLKSVKNGYVTVDAQMFADIDKIVQNLSTYRADFWNDGVSERKRLARMGIENVVELRAYLREFIKFLPGRNIEAEKQRAIKEKERQLANAKIEGFFPTPKAIVEKMLDEADIKPGEKVLEPSAGKGNIADAIRESYPDNALDVVEWNASLNELLTEKGHNVVGVDFLQHSGEYDKIIMNPPFEKGQDIDHIRHAYSLLNDGGRVVCIMSEGPFFRSDKKATEFREWLDSLGGVSEKLPEGAFKSSERSTGVNTRLVVIDKAANDTKPTKSKSSVKSSRDLTTNTEKASAPEYSNYTYKALTDKENMIVTILDSENIYDENGKLKRSHIIDTGIKNVRKRNNPKNTNENAYVYISDIHRDVLVGKRGLSHGLTRKAEATARVTLNIGDILENAIRVNELNPRDNSKGGYVLLGIASDENNNYYPTRIIVNNQSVDEIEVLDVLYAVNTKKKNQFSNETELPADAVPPIKGSSTINISDLLEIVKDDFSDVFSDDVLSNLGVQRKKSTLSESIKYYRNVIDSDISSRWNTDRVAENMESKSTVSISEIIEQISSEFGIPISTGKVTDREASGIYKEKPETIRTRVSNNLPTISHELGHHLDKKYNLNELSSVESIREIVSEEFLDQYPDDAINGELVAEFVRRYLKNSNEANRLCPEFYNDFVRTLSKEDLAAVNKIAKQINEYLSYDIDKRYESSVISAKKAKKMQKLPFAEKWKNLYTGWIDKFHPLKQITDYVSSIKGDALSGIKDAYVLATNSLNAHTIANYQVLEGFRDLNGNFVDDAKSLIDCIGMVNSKDISTLDLYLKLKHALEVISKGKRVFADEVLEDTDNIKKKIAEIEKAHPEMVEAANNLYEFQYNMLKHFAVPSGIMTMEQVEYLHHEYPCYVPFYRFIKNKKGGMFAKSSFVNQSSPIMRQTGSGLDTLSHLESIIRNVEKVIKASVRNQTAAVIGSYADNVDGIGQFIEKVAPDMLPHTIDITALKENFADRLQEVVKSSDDFFAISGLMDEVFGDDVTDFTPVANESKKIISVMRGGERSYYQIHDDTLFSAVAELSPQQANGWIRICNTIMQPMKLLITQNNPIFAATNALRDFGTAYKLSEINNPITFATQYVKALGGIIANSESYKQYKAMGGGHSSELSANIENISKTLRKVAQKDMGKARRLAYSVFRHPVDSVASINDAVESIPRFMEFERTLKENGDLQKAIFNASDITTNFKRSGSSNTAKFVNSSIMFNNAAIQGLDKTFRTLTAKNPKKRYATLTKWLLHAIIMGILGYLYNKEVDEEGYKNLSSYKKNNFYNFAIGDGKFISLPKPRENALLDTVTERTIEYLFGDNEEAFYDFGSYLGSQLLPPMLPDTLHPVDAVHSVGGSTIFGGLLDVGFNKDFKGTPIEGAYDKYTPSNERYTESTTKLAYELGQTKLARDLDMSPKKIDHLISSYTGILGQVNKALFPMNENRKDTSFGLRNKFVSDSNYSTDVLNRMYENQEKAEKAFNYSGSVGDAVEYEKNSIVTSYISGMNKAVKALPEDEQRNGRAYLLKTLNSWNYEDTASQSNMLSSLADSTVSKECIFTDLPSSTLEWTVDKQKYVYQMTPQEYHKYISDYLTVIENARRHYGGDSVESYEAAKEAAKDYMSDYKKNVLKEQYLRKATAKSE